MACDRRREGLVKSPNVFVEILLFFKGLGFNFVGKTFITLVYWPIFMKHEIELNVNNNNNFDIYYSKVLIYHSQI